MKIKGYIVFIVCCADGSYFSGMCENLNEKLKEINAGKGYYFSTHPERLPVSVIFKEENLIFREAYVKHRYLRSMTRRYRDRLIKTGKWPLGKDLRKFITVSAVI